LASRPCANCGAPLDAAQDWCLQCGAGAPGSLATGSGGWRWGATILAATALLAVGAAAAAYAALKEGSAKAKRPTASVVQATAPVAPAAVTPPAGSTPPLTPNAASPGAPSTLKPALPLLAKPPKIPLSVVTPKVTTPSTKLGSGAAGTTSPKTPSNERSPGAGEGGPSAIVLDTNAAATYNPYAYPASNYGDPSLAIDGDAATAWSAKVDPAVAPKMAEGLVIDLKSAQRVSALAITTSTPGMTVQVYGSRAHTLPGSITDPAWVTLSRSQVVKQTKLRIKLLDSKRAFRFLTLWISKAPAAPIGTPQAPGHVSVNELELFPA
jgi:hypothetical protein